MNLRGLRYYHLKPIAAVTRLPIVTRTMQKQKTLTNPCKSPALKTHDAVTRGIVR
jgi:hypothetical protein